MPEQCVAKPFRAEMLVAVTLLKLTLAASLSDSVLTGHRSTPQDAAATGAGVGATTVMASTPWTL
jgi:hypothetical protein